VPLSLGRVIARFQLFSSHLWLALHQIRSSGYPPCPDTPAQPLSRRTPLLVGWRRAVFLLATPAFRLRIISPASEPPLPITASIQIWCQHTHTRIQYSARRMPSALLPCWLLCPCGGGAACPLRCCFAIRCIHILSATLYHSSTASLPSVQPPMLRMPTSPDDPASTASRHRHRRILCTYLYIRNAARRTNGTCLSATRDLFAISTECSTPNNPNRSCTTHTHGTHAHQSLLRITSSPPSAHGIIPASSLLCGTVLSARPPYALPLGLL
jgi:hypothetical protein